jgi:hypothetical protein
MVYAALFRLAAFAGHPVQPLWVTACLAGAAACTVRTTGKWYHSTYTAFVETFGERQLAICTELLRLAAFAGHPI